MSDIRDLFRRRREPMDERIPNGMTPDELVRQVQQQQMPQQLPQQPAPSPRPRFMGNVLAAVNQQPTPQRQAVTPTAQPATLDQALMSGGPTKSEQPQQQAQQGQFNIPENPYRQRLMQDEARLNQLESQPVGFWKRFGTGLLQRAITRRGEAPIPITKRQRDIADVQGRLGREMKIGQDVGQMDAREAAIYARQQQLGQGEERINQGEARIKSQAQRAEDADLLRYYNGRTDFDPNDPAEAAFVARWQKRFGYTPNKNIRGSQLATIDGLDADGNPTVSIINKGTGVVTKTTGTLPVKTDKQLTREQQQKALDEKKREFDLRPPPRTTPNTTPKPNPTHQKAAADAWEKINERNDEIQGVNTEIERVNAMTPEQAQAAYGDEQYANWNKNESIKNQKLRQLDEQRKTAAKNNKAAADSVNMLNSGYDFKVDDQGRVTQSVRGASDLDQPMVGTPTSQGPTLDGAIKAFKAQSKGHRDPTPDELDRIKKHYGFQ